MCNCCCCAENQISSIVTAFLGKQPVLNTVAIVHVHQLGAQVITTGRFDTWIGLFELLDFRSVD